MTITGSARRTIQQWVHKYNKHRIDGLKDKPRPGQPIKLHRRDEPRFCKRIEAGPTKKDGFHTLKKLKIPENVTILPLPAYSPELDPQDS